MFYITNNYEGSLKLNNSYFSSNVVFSIFFINILHDQNFSNVTCIDNNDQYVSGTCFYFENILIQKFYSLFIINSMSSSMTPGIIFLDDITTLQLLIQNINETADVFFIFEILYQFFLIYLDSDINKRFCFQGELCAVLGY